MNSLINENSNLREHIAKLKLKLSENSKIEQSSFMKESDYLSSIYQKDDQISVLQKKYRKNEKRTSGNFSITGGIQK